MARILLVEDNEFNRDMLSRRLERRGFEIDIAVDGVQGLKMADALTHDMILLDLSLPELDGWEVLRQLKENVHTKAIPVIALTAHAMLPDRDRAFAAGFDDYDTKPIDLPRLLGKMDALLSRRRCA
jgi:CheY-like chemotaxis protein